MGWGGRAAARVAMRKGRPESATAGRSSHSVRSPAPLLLCSQPRIILCVLFLFFLLLLLLLLLLAVYSYCLFCPLLPADHG